MRRRRSHFVRLQNSSLGTRSRFTLGNPPSLTAMGSAGVFLLRAQEAGDLKDPILPAEFIRWTGRTGIVLPQELDRRGGGEGEAIFDSRARNTPEYHPRDGDKGVQLRPYEGPLWSPQEIANDLDLLGIGVSVDTVRSKLNEAFNEIGLPPEVQ